MIITSTVQCTNDKVLNIPTVAGFCASTLLEGVVMCGVHQYRHGAAVQVRKAALSQVVPQATGNHAASL